MDNIWSILGIEPTNDIKAIKQAYAAKAKECHPEDHPEEFKTLQNAYRSATARAKNSSAGSSVPTPVILWEDLVQATAPQPQEKPESQEKAEPQEKKESAADYSYEDVTLLCREELSAQFFAEFRGIAWNPYLQNLKSFWRQLLFRIDYEDLYYDDAFRRQFLQETQSVPEWSREILDYFEWCFSLYRPLDSAQWRKVKKRNHPAWLLPEHIVSRAQRLKHHEILQVMRGRGLSDQLLKNESAKNYMNFYRSFLEDNKDWPAEQRKINRQKRRRYRIAICAFFLLIAAIVLEVTAIRPMRNKKELERHAQEEQLLLEEQNRMEEEKWQQELEDRFQTLQEQYEDWMTQDAEKEN